MPSVKERIAALQRQNKAGGSSTSAIPIPHAKNPTKTTSSKFQSIQSRIATAAAQRTMTNHQSDVSNSEERGDVPKPSRSRVASLAQNMNGMDLQSMLSGEQAQNSTSSVDCQQDNIKSGDVMSGGDLQHVKRAVIGRGRRKRRTICTSLEGIKLSTE